MSDNDVKLAASGRQSDLAFTQRENVVRNEVVPRLPPGTLGSCHPHSDDCGAGRTRPGNQPQFPLGHLCRTYLLPLRDPRRRLDVAADDRRHGGRDTAGLGVRRHARERKSDPYERRLVLGLVLPRNARLHPVGVLGPVRGAVPAHIVRRALRPGTGQHRQPLDRHAGGRRHHRARVQRERLSRRDFQGWLSRHRPWPDGGGPGDRDVAGKDLDAYPDSAGHADHHPSRPATRRSAC